MKEIINTDAAPNLLPLISQATKAGGFVFVSGQIGRNAEGQLVSGGMEAEARQIFKNLEAILAAAGATMSSVLRVEVFVADLSEMPAFNDVFRDVFPEKPPARLGVEVSKLPANARVEVTAIAYAG